MELHELYKKPAKIKQTLLDVFEGEAWLESFFIGDHHGFEHGDDVRKRCLGFIEKLTDEEKQQLEKEGVNLDTKFPIKSATAAIEIAAILHDCGRIDDQGKLTLKTQKSHHIIGAKRALVFCTKLGFKNASEVISGAILSHDYQSKAFTPEFKPPHTIIGKIVQAADQVSWFHPDSIYRTLKYNEELGAPFYDSKFDIRARVTWKYNSKPQDAVTVMLHQLFGPCHESRFGIMVAQILVKQDKTELRSNILKMAEDHGVKKEIEKLMNEFEKNIT